MKYLMILITMLAITLGTSNEAFAQTKTKCGAVTSHQTKKATPAPIHTVSIVDRVKKMEAQETAATKKRNKKEIIKKRKAAIR